MNSIDWLIEKFYNNEGMITTKQLEQAREMYQDEIEAAIIKDCATESTSAASSYAEGYKEGYNRAIELTKWAISNLIPPHNEQQ